MSRTCTAQVHDLAVKTPAGAGVDKSEWPLLQASRWLWDLPGPATPLPRASAVRRRQMMTKSKQPNDSNERTPPAPEAPSDEAALFPSLDGVQILITPLWRDADLLG